MPEHAMTMPNAERLVQGATLSFGRGAVPRRCWTAHSWVDWADTGSLGLLHCRFCAKCGQWGLRRATPDRVLVPGTMA